MLEQHDDGLATWKPGVRVLVTGGSGFIGSALVRRLVGRGCDVLNIDLLTYASDARNLAAVEDRSNYCMIKADVADAASINRAFQQFQPDCVFHLAAESHVDRSIDAPRVFIDTNVTGTCVMLDATRSYLMNITGPSFFRFVHVSTDEVYGSLGPEGLFSEKSSYAPRSPYSASKASADMLARAWHHTYGLPILISNCSNNYGPHQNAEKLVPTVISNALLGRPIPIYGDGKNIRDWLYVEDHVDALLALASNGRVGESYNVGGDNEMQNIEIATSICMELDKQRPRPSGNSYADQITFVADRPGHDRRYAVDASKIRCELGWRPNETFETGIRRTVQWYCNNESYWRTSASVAKRLGRA